MDHAFLFVASTTIGVGVVAWWISKWIVKCNKRHRENSKEGFFTGKHKPFEPPEEPLVSKTILPEGRATGEEIMEKKVYVLDKVEDIPLGEEEMARDFSEGIPKQPVEVVEIKEELTEEEKEFMEKYKQEFNSRHDNQII